LINKKYKVTVVGLGKLGACLAAILAEKKFSVTGIDINSTIVDSINKKKAPVLETGLDQLIKKTGKYLVAHHDLKLAASKADIIFLVLPTPSKKDDTFSLKYILNACESIGFGLKTNPHQFPLIVLTSTVIPGDCEHSIIPRLEKISGKKCGVDFGFCYNPEFIALGSVIKDMQNPDLVLIGEYNEASGKKLMDIYPEIIENKATVERMNLVNAEIVKLSINTYVTTKISYANMLTQICHHTPNADIDVISKTLGKDSRIGQKYLTGGSPYGGPCFPRDNRAFIKMAKNKNLVSHIASATDQVNDDHLEFIFHLIKGASAKIKSIGLLGLSYKPATSVLDESSGIQLAKKLIRKNYKVSFYDPNVAETNIKKLHKSTWSKILSNSDMIIILNNDKAYTNFEPEDIKPKTLVLDCWRILNTKKWKNYSQLISLGVGKKL